MAKLTAKQERFVEEYLVDLNATQAAIRAGYSVRSANKIGSELLGKTGIRSRIDQHLAELSKRTGINQERIMRELARIAFLDPTKLADMNYAEIHTDATEDDRAVIQSIKVKRFPTQEGEGIEREIRFADKLRALELLGKRFGMWIDRRETDLTAKVEIVDDVPRGPTTKDSRASLS